MHCKTRENWPFSALFFDFRVILTSGGYLLKLTLKDSQGCGFRIAQVVRCHSENGTFVFRESVSEFRELLREYPGTLPELREWPFHYESVFPEIGVVPRLLINACFTGHFSSTFKDNLRK